MNACVADCGRPARGAFLCRGCARELAQAIAELPSDLADLERVATRQARGPLGLGDPNRFHGRTPGGDWERVEALRDEPWPFAPGAADQAWALRNTVVTWVRHLCESRGAHYPALWRIDAVCTWLIEHIESIRQDEAAAQVHDELTWLHQENQRWILGRPPADEFFGLCDQPDVAVSVSDDGKTLSPNPTSCGAQLFAQRGAQAVSCPACGATYSRAERHAAMVEDMRDHLATVSQVAASLTTLGRTVTVNQIRGWLRRGLITARGADRNGYRLVRVGDVLTQQQALSERTATRRKRAVA